MMGRCAAALIVAGALLTTPLPIGAQGRSGGTYFQNLGLQPVGNASRSLITQEPAAVLVFSGGAGSADATALYNTWVNKTTRTFRGAAFGVAHRPIGQPREIFEEVLSQRELNFPVFTTETDLLNGRDYRLMVVAGGLAYDVPGLDFAALDAELARHSGGNGTPQVAGTPASPAPTPEGTPVPTATPQPTPVVPATPAAPVMATGTPVATATPAPSPTASPTPEGDATLGTGRYFNNRYGLTVEFPRGWTYRVARNNDGAVGRAPAGRNVDLRVWAVPASQMAGGTDGQMGITDYIEEHLNLISEQTGSRVGVLQRFRVDDEGVRGYDYTYTFSRPAPAGTTPPTPGGRAPLVLHRGRIQVFQTDNVFKVVSAEAPSGEFERSGPILEEFIQSFHPFIADEQGNPVSTPAAGSGAAGAGAAGAEAAPAQAGDPGPGARPVVEPRPFNR